MDLIKSLKLYRIATVIKYMGQSWGNSKFVAQQKPGASRLLAYLDLLYWFYFYGNDFNDYCSFRFWDKTRKEKKSYISLRRNDALRFALSTPRVYGIFLDKVKFNNRFSSYITRQWLEVGENDETRIKEFISKYNASIFKPRADFGGHGITKISSASDYSNCASLKNGVLEECIENSDNLRRLAPGSLNTVRIVTLIDKTGKLNILAAVLRMGNGLAFTDNYHDGGMACAIDVNTGKLKGKAYGMNCREYAEHPFSKIMFDSYQVCGFKECVKLVHELAFVEPEARYVGWDFAITPNGIDVIEGNIPPGEDITQIAAGRGLYDDILKLI